MNTLFKVIIAILFVNYFLIDLTEAFGKRRGGGRKPSKSGGGKKGFFGGGGKKKSGGSKDTAGGGGGKQKPGGGKDTAGGGGKDTAGGKGTNTGGKKDHDGAGSHGGKDSKKNKHRGNQNDQQQRGSALDYVDSAMDIKGQVEELTGTSSISPNSEEDVVKKGVGYDDVEEESASANKTKCVEKRNGIVGTVVGAAKTAVDTVSSYVEPVATFIGGVGKAVSAAQTGVKTASKVVGNVDCDKVDEDSEIVEKGKRILNKHDKGKTEYEEPDKEHDNKTDTETGEKSDEEEEETDEANENGKTTLLDKALVKSGEPVNIICSADTVRFHYTAKQCIVDLLLLRTNEWKNKTHGLAWFNIYGKHKYKGPPKWIYNMSGNDRDSDAVQNRKCNAATMKISILIPAAEPADAGRYICLLNAGEKRANISAVLTVAFSEDNGSQSSNLSGRPGYNQVINCVLTTETSTIDLYSEGIAMSTCGTIVIALFGVWILLSIT